MKNLADIGMVGLAVMGENLVLNMESKGFTVACFNRTTSKVDDFITSRADVSLRLHYPFGIPMPAIGAALAYYDGYRSARLPANLLQAQRDYFGAHTYERVNRPRGEFFHANWTGHGGSTSSSTYNV